MRLAFVTALAACSHPSAPRAPAVPTAVPTAAPTEARLGIAPLVLYFNGSIAWQMRDDGSVWPTDRDHALFTVRADGRIVGQGGAHGELRTDGRVVRPDGSVSQGVIEGDRLLLGGRTLTLDEQGVVQISGPAIAGTPPRVAGIVDAPTRRTALLLVGMILEAAFTGPAGAR